MNKQTTIWVINQFASLPRYSYGAGERFFFLSKYLSKNYKIKVISGGFSHLFKEYPNTPNLFNSEITPDAEYVWVKLKRYQARQYMWRTLSWFEFAFKLFFLPIKKSKPDLVIVSSMSLFPIVYAVWLKWRYNIKFVLEIRDIWPLTPIEIGGYSKFHPLIMVMKMIERWGYQQADSIVSVLPNFKEYLDENGFHKKKFVWIPNGISEKHSNKAVNPLFNLPENKFNVLYAGTVGNANAMEYFIEAARLLCVDNNNIHFNIIGDGPLKTSLEEQSKGLSNVTFYPKILKEELYPIVNQADVCYIGWHDKSIYRYGVSANKYNDYMLAKKAILSSSNISMDPVVMANCGMNVPAARPDLIVTSLLKFQAMTKEQISTMGENGYNFLLNNQVYSKLAKKYISTINASLNE